MQVVDNLVVHRAAKLRVRMQHNRDRCIALWLWVVAAFKSAFWAWKDYLGHIVCLFLENARGLS
jgi:hypothetical protein